MTQIYVFTAGNAEARRHLDDSIRRPVQLERALEFFPREQHEEIARLHNEHGLYAWGAVPGRMNNPLWNLLQINDWVFCVFDSRYRYAARVTAKFDNARFANEVWGLDPVGRTWQLMYFLTKPVPIDVPVSAGTPELASGYQGFSKVGPERLEAIVANHGSIDSFVSERFFQGNAVPTAHVNVSAKKQFTINGVAFSFSREDAEKAFAETVKRDWISLAGADPYVFVELDTARKPAKAVFRHMPGVASRFEFTTNDAKRVFEALGLTVVNVNSAEPVCKLCLLGTWSNWNEDRLQEISESIRDHGGWASKWSFVIQDAARPQLTPKFWIYINTGGATFPCALLCDGFESQSGNEGIASPWPEMTDPALVGLKRAGESQHQIFKTWLRVIVAKKIEPPLNLDDFELAEGLSAPTNVLNQNAFGYAYLKSMASAPEPVERYGVDDALDGLFIDESTLDEMRTLLLQKKNLIIQGAPGVGKTYLAKRLARVLVGVSSDSNIGSLQFHQSYSYEDFVQGYRPKDGGGFERKDGVLLRFCRRAANDPSHRYVLIIDEINRGNLSKIFGETMVLVESDKRDPSHAVALTYSKEGEEDFYIPPNVYLLGLMNTADRSLAIVDYALRRRFAFVTLAPAFDHPNFENELRGAGASSALVAAIRGKMKGLNERITTDRDLGAGFCVGHSYFCPNGRVGEYNADWYTRVIRTEIAPLLKEYWFDKSAGELDEIVGDLLAVQS
jgi:AAA domain (dynein-related subfamily)